MRRFFCIIMSANRNLILKYKRSFIRKSILKPIIGARNVPMEGI